MEDNVPCHLLCSAIAGFTACVIGSPVDVLKTRIMNAKPGQAECELEEGEIPPQPVLGQIQPQQQLVNIDEVIRGM